MSSLANDLLQHSKLGKGTEPTDSEKWWASILLGLLFSVLSSSVSYGVTNMVSKSFCLPGTCGGNSGTLWGLLLHTVLFTLIVRMILR